MGTLWDAFAVVGCIVALVSFVGMSIAIYCAYGPTIDTFEFKAENLWWKFRGATWGPYICGTMRRDLARVTPAPGREEG